ncbi:MAG: hypothetical protein K2G55_19145 [Lachnospiraceae bacterium]|nr:hypothetical protein [Lachnospiraceae bacterium]MDE7203084.1 hypothetical protein [Lachnospiraceae bacterium]
MVSVSLGNTRGVCSDRVTTAIKPMTAIAEARRKASFPAISYFETDIPPKGSEGYETARQQLARSMFHNQETLMNGTEHPYQP